MPTVHKEEVDGVIYINLNGEEYVKIPLFEMWYKKEYETLEPEFSDHDYLDSLLEEV